MNEFTPHRVPSLFYDIVKKKPITFKYINNIDTFSEYFVYNKIPYRIQTKYSYLCDDIKQDVMIFFIYDRREHAQVPNQIHILLENIFNHIDDDLKPFIREIKIEDLIK
jgi:hypothetical protein